MLPDYRVGALSGAPAEPKQDAVEDLDAEDDGSVERRVAVVPPESHGERLDKFLVRMAPELSRSHLQGLIAAGCVQVDSLVVASASRKVHVHQSIQAELVPAPESQAFKPEQIPLDIVFEDESLLVLNKPSGMVVHPAAGNWSGTVLNGLLAHHAAAAKLPRAGIVHRLDKDTSGLMVVGKTLTSVTALVRAIAAREVSRQYLAIVHGALERSRLEIDAPIGRDPRSRVRMCVLSSGRVARTDVQRLEVSQGFSAVHCVLHTGRTHQIRVHLAHQGHSLVADAVYGGRPGLGLMRQALHATVLGFVHPLSGESMRFRCHPPSDFTSAWAVFDTPLERVVTGL